MTFGNNSAGSFWTPWRWRLWSAETCKEWINVLIHWFLPCICRYFTHHIRIHGPNWKKKKKKYFAAWQHWIGRPLLCFNYNLVLLAATCRSMTIQSKRIVEFRWQKWLRERASILICTCIDWPVCILYHYGSANEIVCCKFQLRLCNRIWGCYLNALREFPV
jgi:hypothetical protein